MRKSGILYSGVAAIAIAAVLTTASCLPARAQQSPAAAIHIGDTDLGGMVTSANGPEAGVWVIAETTDLPTKFAKIVVTDDQGRYVLPDLPKANYNVWVRGYGLVDSPKVQTQPGKMRQSDGGGRARTRRRRRNIIRPIIGISMLKIPDKSEFPGAGTKERHDAGEHAEPVCMARQSSRATAASAAISSARRRRATIPAAFGTFRRRRRLGAAHPVRPGGRATWSRPSACFNTQSAFDHLRRLDRPDRQGRTARHAAAAAAGRRAQRRGDLMGLGQRHDLSARRDLDRQAQSDRQRLRQDLRFARTEHGRVSRARSRQEYGELPQIAGARSEDADDQGLRRRWRPRPIGATSPSGTARPSRTIRCSTRRAGSGSRRASGRPTIRLSASRARICLRRNSRRSRPPAASSTMYDPKSGEDHARSTPVSARIICSSASTPTTRCG